MTRRESLILSITGLAAVGAAVYYSGLFGPPVSSPEAASATNDPAGDLARFTTRFQSIGLDEWESAVLRSRQLDWGGNPFARPFAVGASVPVVGPEALRYTGFMRIGEVRIGIINGQEYEPGMWFEDGSHRIIDLGPGKATLVRAGSSQEISLEMENDL